ncbi:MAG TPA: N-6 DNA methylase [Microthrixaceae bacterium]|nr:N-6 DNA methylase [Microthrixaceae bacterium]
MLTPGARSAADIGRAYEATLPEQRRRRGAHYTPVEVARALVARALDVWRGEGLPTVIDPSCGAGAFLVGACDELVARGHAPAAALGSVAGIDSDVGAVDAARAALAAWAGAHEVDPAHLDDISAVVRPGDGLATSRTGGWDLVVGNPPFGGQLSNETTRTAAERRRARERWGPAVTGYLDTSALFALAAAGMIAPGGVLAMVQPRSVLSARHAVAFRSAITDGLALREIWLPATQVFEAQVDVCAIVLTRGRSRSRVGITDEPIPSAPVATVAQSELTADSWGPALAALRGVPAVADLDASGGTVGELARCTAGFRDEYYALLAHCCDERPAGAARRLVTSGAIDPLRCWWGERPIRFGRRSWRSPWLDLDALEQDSPAIARWVGSLSVPKLIVATQTRSIEIVVDTVGDLVPITPALAVVPHDATRLSHLAAVLHGPVAAVVAHRRLAGTGMSPLALRLTAGVVADLPLPVDETAWTEAASVLGADGLLHFGTLMAAAHGVDPGVVDELVAWWARDSTRRVAGDQIDADRGAVVT